MFFKRHTIPAQRERSANYKTEEQLTKEDYAMIDADRELSGIHHYSDEYYYNHILFYNFV